MKTALIYCHGHKALVVQFKSAWYCSRCKRPVRAPIGGPSHPAKRLAEESADRQPDSEQQV